MALTAFYFVNSFTSDLPWSECEDEWNTMLNSSDLICVPSKGAGSDYKQNNTISSSELYFK